MISTVGIFLDTIGTSLRGRKLAEGFCQFEGFFYMLIGQFIDCYQYELSQDKIHTYFASCIISHIDEYR